MVVSDVERMAQWRSAWSDDVDDDATLQAFHVIGDTKGGRKGGKGGGAVGAVGAEVAARAAVGSVASLIALKRSRRI